MDFGQMEFDNSQMDGKESIISTVHNQLPANSKKTERTPSSLGPLLIDIPTLKKLLNKPSYEFILSLIQSPVQTSSSSSKEDKDSS